MGGARGLTDGGAYSDMAVLLLLLCYARVVLYVCAVTVVRVGLCLVVHGEEAAGI